MHSNKNFNLNCNWSDYFCFSTKREKNSNSKPHIIWQRWPMDWEHTRNATRIKFVVLEWFRAWKTELIVFVCDHNFYLEIKMVLTHSHTYSRTFAKQWHIVYYKHSRMLLFFFLTLTHSISLSRFIFHWKQPIRIHHINKAMKSFFLPVSIHLVVAAFTIIISFFHSLLLLLFSVHIVHFSFFSMSIFLFIKTLFVCLPKGNLIPAQMCLY